MEFFWLPSGQLSSAGASSLLISISFFPSSEAKAKVQLQQVANDGEKEEGEEKLLLMMHWGADSKKLVRDPANFELYKNKFRTSKNDT